MQKYHTENTWKITGLRGVIKNPEESIPKAACSFIALAQDSGTI